MGCQVIFKTISMAAEDILLQPSGSYTPLNGLRHYKYSESYAYLWT